MTCFIYQNLQSELKAQNVLIDLGIHCLSFANFVDYDLRTDYLDAVRLVFQRGELLLTSLKIEDSDSTRPKNKAIQEMQLKIAVKYQYLQYESLRYCLDQLNRKAADFYKIQYMISSIALSFFRVPEFRESFLKAMAKDGFVEIPEWKGIRWALEDEETDDIENVVDHFFKWHEYLYLHIPESKHKQINLNILSNIITMHDWENRIAKRGVAMYLIIAKWAESVKNTIVNDKADWKNVPGYKTILKTVFTEMKSTPISEYKEALADATVSLLANEEILFVFIEIAFKKTNIYEQKDVDKAMDLTVKWLEALYNAKKSFPSNFDFAFYFKAIEILIDYDHAISTQKCLWMIYKTFHIYPLSDQLILAELLLEKKFDSLFFSWSWNIRNVFHKIYLYQFHNVFENKNVIPPQQNNADSSLYNNNPKRLSSKNLKVNEYKDL